jgi:hypothetical protein
MNTPGCLVHHRLCSVWSTSRSIEAYTFTTQPHVVHQLAAFAWSFSDFNVFLPEFVCIKATAVNKPQPTGSAGFRGVKGQLPGHPHRKRAPTRGAVNLFF